MDDFFGMYSNTETLWITAKMSTRQKKISEYFALNKGPQCWQLSVQAII
jgi:hypothetical protein